MRFTDALSLLLAGQDTPADEARALAHAPPGAGARLPDLPLSRTAAAHAALESRQTTGKVVLVPDA